MAPTYLLLAQALPPLVGALAALAVDAYERRSLAVFAASLGMFAGGVVGAYAGWGEQVRIAYDVFLTGGAFSTLAGAAGILGAVSVAGARHTLVERNNGGTLAALVAFGVFSAGLIVGAIDLIVLLIVLETAALAAYALVSAGATRRAEESAIKYYVQGAVATGLLVLGISVLVGGHAPGGSYVQLAAALVEGIGRGATSSAVFGLVFIVAALAFKAGAAPFHPWAPDAYEHARPESSAFLAGPLKAAFLFALALLLVTFAPIGATASRPLGLIGTQLLPVVGILAVLSIGVGSLAALRQRSYLRMLGYAGVAQVGYGLVAATALNVTAVAIFAVTYAVAATGAFLAAAAVRRVDSRWDGSIEGMAGLSVRSPVLAGALCVLMASLAGLPPLIGFWGKFQALISAISAAGRFSIQGLGGLAGFYWFLAAAALVGSVISIAYYGSVIRAVFSRGDDSVEGHVPASAAWGVVALAALALVLGLAPLLTGLANAMTGFSIN